MELCLVPGMDVDLNICLTLLSVLFLLLLKLVLVMYQVRYIGKTSRFREVMDLRTPRVVIEYYSSDFVCFRLGSWSWIHEFFGCLIDLYTRE